MSFDDFSYKIFNDAILSKIANPGFYDANSTFDSKLDDRKPSNLDVTQMGLPLTANKVLNFEEMSSHDGDGIDDSGQNLGTFLPTEV